MTKDSAKQKAIEIIDELSNRGGFDGWWDHIDDDIQEEIIQGITEIIKK